MTSQDALDRPRPRQKLGKHVAVLTRTPRAAEIRKVLIGYFVDAENEALRRLATRADAAGGMLQLAFATAAPPKKLRR